MASFVRTRDQGWVNLDWAMLLKPHRHDEHTGEITSYLVISASDGGVITEISAKEVNDGRTAQAT